MIGEGRDGKDLDDRWIDRGEGESYIYMICLTRSTLYPANCNSSNVLSEK